MHYVTSGGAGGKPQPPCMACVGLRCGAYPVGDDPVSSLLFSTTRLPHPPSKSPSGAVIMWCYLVTPSFFFGHMRLACAGLVCLGCSDFALAGGGCEPALACLLSLTLVLGFCLAAFVAPGLACLLV